MTTDKLLLTPAQQEAVDSLDTDCIVSAGAGSGKTRVLVERFLHILSRHLDEEDAWERVVAITFTEKAASEMKERIRSGVTARWQTAKESGKEREAGAWHRLLTEMEQARITTIHAFCARLLREYPVEAGLDPGFRVLDEAEGTVLLREAIQQALNRSFARLPQQENGTSAVERTWMRWGVDKTVEQIAGVYRAMLNQGLVPQRLSEVTRDHLQKTRQQLQEKIRTGLLDVLSAGDQLMQVEGGKKAQAFQEAWPSLAASLKQGLQPGEWLPTLREAEALLKGNWGKKEEVTLPRDRMRTAVAAWSEVLEGWMTLSEERELVDWLLPLLAEVDERYRKAKEKRHAVDFDEMQIRSVQLFRTHPRVYRKERDRIAYLMVDEFQDTNEAQKQLVDLLSLGADGQPQPGKLFVVGDPKQSIYRFRGSDVEVFSATRRDIQTRGGKEVALVDNFRSDPAVIAFVNGLFEKLMSSDPEEANYYRAALAKRSSAKGPRVEWICLPDREDCPEGREVRDVEADVIARRIGQFIHEGRKPGEIAVLFQTMKHVKRYEEALLLRGIPFYVVKGRGFYERQEVQDVLHFLRYAADMSDRLSLVGVLRSPFCGLSDETLWLLSRREQWESDPDSWLRTEGLPDEERLKLRQFLRVLHGVRQRAGRVAVAELMESLLEESGYRQVLWSTPFGKQAVANLEKLVQVARGWEEGADPSLNSFLRKVEEWAAKGHPETEAQVEEADGNSVKLMTIHQSKGLEFPVVFVPDLSRRQPVKVPDVLLDPEKGLSITLTDDWGERRESFRWKQRAEEERKREREESVRLFYVAVTRAEDRLILSGTPEEHKGFAKGEPILSGDTWSKWLNGAFGEIGNCQERWEPITGVHIQLRKWEEAGEPLPVQLRSERAKADLLSRISMADHVQGLCLETRGYGEDDLLPVSVTDVTRLANCPRRYFYERMWQLPQVGEGWDEPSGTVEGSHEARELTPQIKGEVVHRVLEWCKGDETADDVAPLIREAFAEINADSSSPAAVEEVQKLVQVYLASEYHGTGYESVRKEARFLQPMAGLKLEGIIDRLHRGPDGEWELVDYKTNGISAEEVEETAEEYLPQIQLYVLAAKEAWNLSVRRAVLYFLQPDRQKRWEVNPQWLQQAQATLHTVSHMLRQEEKPEAFPPRPGKRCQYCAYRFLCEEGDQG
jgi:ATP-dependent helicase/nuclease subunit A